MMQRILTSWVTTYQHAVATEPQPVQAVPNQPVEVMRFTCHAETVEPSQRFNPFDPPGPHPLVTR